MPDHLPHLGMDILGDVTTTAFRITRIEELPRLAAFWSFWSVRLSGFSSGLGLRRRLAEIRYSCKICKSKNSDVTILGMRQSVGSVDLYRKRD